MALTSRSWRLANLETPDLSNANSYRVQRRPFNRVHVLVQRATRLLKLLREERWGNLLLTKAELDPNFLVDSLWHPDRLLGAGSFGEVATWSRLDNSGNVIDEVAIKSIKNQRLKKWTGNADLATEAVLQRELNLQNCENVAHLRAYKVFMFNQPQTQPPRRFAPPVPPHCEWRLYQELAPYGPLNSLIAKYRYWRTSLPEAFLWHLFDSLAQSAVAMRACSPPNPLFGRTFDASWTDTQLVTLDLKAGNVVLGHPDHRAQSAAQPVPSFGGTRRYNYPVIKLIDFGVAYFTGPGDTSNPVNYEGQGTAMNQPPEQIHYGCEWPQPGCRNADYLLQQRNDLSEYHPTMDGPAVLAAMTLNQSDQIVSNARYNFKLLENVHVWAIGKVLFEALTLDAQTYKVRDPEDPDGDLICADPYWMKSTYSYQEFQRNGEHQLADFNVQAHKDTFWTGDSPYSQELTDLIRDCLRPVVAQRPTAANLRTRTRAGMQRWDAKYVDGCEDTDHKTPKGVDFPRLYYRANDINLMPLGKQPVTTDAVLYTEFQTMSPYDPDLPPLKPSWEKGIAQDDRWQDHSWNPKNFTAYQDGWITHNGQLMRRAVAESHVPPLDPDPILSPTSTEDPSDPEFRLQARTKIAGGRKKLSYRFTPAVQNPNSRANKKRLAAKNTSVQRAKNAHVIFNKARTRNALRRLEAAEAAQRARPPPVAVAAAGLPPPPPPPPPPPGGVWVVVAPGTAVGLNFGANVGGNGGNGGN